MTSPLGFVCLMPAPSTFDDVVQLGKAWVPPNSGSIWRTAFRRSSSIRSCELPLPLGSAVGAAPDVVRYRTLSSQENIWDTEQREQ